MALKAETKGRSEYTKFGVGLNLNQKGKETVHNAKQNQKGSQVNMQQGQTKSFLFLLARSNYPYTHSVSMKVLLFQGYNCCSESMISFHHVTPNEMYAMEIAHYNVKLASVSRAH